MRKLRAVKPQRIYHVQVPGCVVEVIVATYHMRDAHVRIINNHAKMKSRRAIRADNNQIVQHGVVIADRAAHTVCQSPLHRCQAS